MKVVFHVCFDATHRSIFIVFTIGLVLWIQCFKRKKKTIITFMRVKCGIMALAAVLVSLIEARLAVRQTQGGRGLSSS